MSLVFAGITPSIETSTTSPLTVQQAIHELEGELYCMKPDILILLIPSSHHNTTTYESSIAPILHDHTSRQWNTDSGFIVHLKEVLDAKQPSLFTINAEETLDTITATMLAQFTAHTPHISVVVITVPTVPYEIQYLFGETLRHEMQLTNKRMAVIATGVLQPKESSLNEIVHKCITQLDIQCITQLRPELIQHSNNTLLNPLITLMAIIKDIGCHIQPLGDNLPAHLPVIQIVVQ